MLSPSKKSHYVSIFCRLTPWGAAAPRQAGSPRCLAFRKQGLWCISRGGAMVRNS